MPKFATNTGFKMPGVGSRNIDSPGNFRDEQHVDKVGYCDTTEDSMLPEGSSPLKARYTTSGYRKDLKEVDLNLRKKKEGCPEGYVKKGEECVKLPEKKKQPEVKKPVDEKVNPKGSVKVPELGETKIEPNYKDTTVSGNSKGKTSYSGGGKLKNKDQKDFYDKEVKRLGGVQQYRDFYKIGEKTTKDASSITGKTKL